MEQIVCGANNASNLERRDTGVLYFQPYFSEDGSRRGCHWVACSSGRINISFGHYRCIAGCSYPENCPVPIEKDVYARILNKNHCEHSEHKGGNVL